MVKRTISDNAALFVLEQWYSKPEEERIRFRSFCFQAGLFDNDFKYVNNIKRVADCHIEPMKYIQRQLSVIAESENEDVEEVSQEQSQEQEQSEDAADDVQENNTIVEQDARDKYEERLDVVVVRQGFTNMLLILLILVTSPFLAYNLMHIYNNYFRTYDIIYLIETPDVIYL